MRTFTILFVLSQCFIECHQKALTDNDGVHSRSCISAGKSSAFINLLKKKLVSVSALQDCKVLMTRRNPDIGELRRYEPLDVCNAGYPLNNPTGQIYAYVAVPQGSVITSCGIGAIGKSYYLSQDPDKSTYMIIDKTRANWFFTTTLSGCDIFIAVNPRDRGKPLVIHANQNKLKGKHEQNFQAKQTNTNKILQRHEGYVLKARLHPLRQGMTTFWKGYDRTYKGVKRKTYDTISGKAQSYTFFGYYNRPRGSWVFIYKGQLDGAVSILYDTRSLV